MCSSLRKKSLLAPVGLAVLCATLHSAAAAPVIGTTTGVTQSVTGGFGGKLAPMKVSDPVILEETVRTNASGEGRFTLEESTNLTIFSRSAIRVERFAPTNVVMTTEDGTFAVTTGRLPPGSYRIDTSAGTLTPHGTIFTFSVRGGRLTLDVQQGAVTFCPRGKSRAYCVDAVPGHSVVGQAGAPPQIFGYAGPPPSSPTLPPAQPMRYAPGPQGPTGCGSLAVRCPGGWPPPTKCGSYYPCGPGSQGPTGCNGAGALVVRCAGGPPPTPKCGVWFPCNNKYKQTAFTGASAPRVFGGWARPVRNYNFGHFGGGFMGAPHN